MTIRRELIDELLKDYPNPQDVLAEDGLLKQLTRAVIERCLETELDSHLGYPKHRRHGNAEGNTRNGTSQKTVKGEQGHIEIDVPRDRQGMFEPQLVKKGQTRLAGFDEKILTLYARGMTTRDIQAQLQERDARGGLPHAHLECDRGGDGGGAKDGRAVRWRRSIRSSIWTAWSSKSRRTGASVTKRSIWRWESR